MQEDDDIPKELAEQARLRMSLLREMYAAGVEFSYERESDEDRTGLCTVRDAVSFMFENKTDVMEMYFRHEGREWNVEICILRAEEDAETPNVKWAA